MAFEHRVEGAVVRVASNALDNRPDAGRQRSAVVARPLRLTYNTPSVCHTPIGASTIWSCRGNCRALTTSPDARGRTTEKQTIQQTQLAGKCLAGSPHRLVTDGQTDRRTVALVDAGGLVTDGQTDRRTVALDYADGLVTDGQTDRQTYRGVTDVKTALFA